MSLRIALLSYTLEFLNRIRSNLSSPLPTLTPPRLTSQLTAPVVGNPLIHVSIRSPHTWLAPFDSWSRCGVLSSQ